MESDTATHQASSARHLQGILDHMPSMIGYWGSDLRNRFGNHAYQAWFGIDPKTMPGMHIRDVIGEERYRLNLPYIEGALRGERQTFERAIPALDGSHLRYSLAEYIPEMIDGRVVGFYVLVSDVTPVKAAEAALRESEERYRAVLADQTEVISRYRADGTMIFANEVYCRLFGKTESQIVGRSWTPVAHPDDVAMIEAKLASLAPDNPVVTIENRVYAADGSERWMQFVNRAFFDQLGLLREIQSVGRDISDRKLAEEKLAASRARLHALLTANDSIREEQRKEIAQDVHDQLGAALTAISFRLDALLHQSGQDSATAGELARIKGMVASASGVARDICTRLRPPILDDLGLIAACRWYVQDWRDSVGIPVKGHFVRLKSEPSDHMRTDIFRVLQELLTNVARHAGASSVKVSISAGRNGLRLSVADDGHGLPVGWEGKGYGLLGIRERVERHGGKVGIVSGVSGTTITLTFPMAGES